jgi:hypothetical protein
MHGQAAAADLARCADCHRAEAAGAGGDPHGTTCTKCHVPHGPPEAARSRCLGCHEKVEVHASARAAPHRACESCHSPHGGSGKVEARCRTCHADEKSSLEPWSTVDAHQQCSDCHRGHQAGRPEACGTCHRDEAQRAAGTKHADCRACHPPHQSSAVGAAAWKRSCGRCHQAIVAGVAERGPTHARCESCHAPHDVAPPRCDDCHADVRQQLMHRVGAHQKSCADCHVTHDSKAPTRATCGACHASQEKSHYPEAKRCDACHPFARGGSEGIRPAP